MKKNNEKKSSGSSAKNVSCGSAKSNIDDTKSSGGNTKNISGGSAKSNIDDTKNSGGGIKNIVDVVQRSADNGGVTSNDTTQSSAPQNFYGDLITEEYLSGIAHFVQNELESRALARRELEAKWRLNIDFLAGRQYSEISPLMEITECTKRYEWQSREVFNHVAPIVETRCAKLSRVRPKMSVRAGGDEDSDLYAAKLSSKILNNCYYSLGLDSVINSATMWSEVCGTEFYKAGWDLNLGRVVGSTEDGRDICDGDVSVSAVPPFEIFPHSLHIESVEGQQSIIHAKPMHTADIFKQFGVEVKAQGTGALTFNIAGQSGTVADSALKDYAVVAEYYEMPTSKYPRGRFIVVAGDRVVHLSGLIFNNGWDGKPALPFIKQSSVHSSGNFFGISIIERCIPVQRAYNAVKNRKHEFLNRIAAGVLAVEDGSVDIDILEEEGLAPGRVVVYRQGAAPPVMMETGRVPADFNAEEERLLQEFKLISGVSDVMRNSATQSNLTSGVAISLLIEQDDTRLSVSAENIRRAVKELGRHILRLYKQYASAPRLLSVAGDNNAIEKLYFSSREITSDDIIFETENELSQSPAQRKSLVLDMLKAGLLSDENGNLSMRMKSRIADLLGFSDFENGQDIINLNIKRAAKENLILLKSAHEPLEIDDHHIHIDEHIKFMLSGEFERDKSKDKTQNFLRHIQKHKQLASLSLSADLAALGGE